VAVDPGALYRSFLAGLAEPVRRQLGPATDEASLNAALVAHWVAAIAAWPGIAVAPDRFARELARRTTTTPPATPHGTESVTAVVAAARGGDIYFAIACCDGDATAIARLDELVATELDRAGRKLRAAAEQIAELRGELARLLLVDEPGRTAGLREFAGRGELRGYVRVMATRALIRAINRGRRELAIDDDAFFDRVLPPDDPELGYLRTRYRATVDAALRAALAQLDDRDRALLRYLLIDGWSIDRVGKLYGVHRATAARWLADARDVLGAAIRAELSRRLQIAADEVDSIVRLVQSRVDLSLDRLLVPDRP